MIRKRKLKLALMTFIAAAALSMTACGSSDISDIVSATVEKESLFETEKDSLTPSDAETKDSPSKDNLSSGSSTVSTSTLLDTSDMFSDRDLEQEADLSDATYITLENGEDVNITSEGVYVISGSAKNTSIIVEADDTAKVQIVLDGVTITNSDSPAIYVKSADKVFVTTTDSDNTLKVTGSFSADGETNTDAVIFSKEDLVLNGKGTLTVESTENGITSKDDLKITGGTYNITSDADAIEANDSIRVYDGTFNIDTEKDALHSEDSDDGTTGFIYIQGGTFNIEADSDGIRATTVLVIDGGTFDITASEGLEGTYVQINDGTINIEASDDGINATQKSSSYDVVIEVNGGDITVVMGSGDTDGFDSNGCIYINGGTIDVTANSAFDWDKEAQLNGGTVIVNGEEVTELTSQMMGGGMGGPGGQNGQMQGGPGGQATDGEAPQAPDGEAPQAPNGEAPQAPDGQTPPEGFDPSSQGGKMKGGPGGH